MLRLDQLTIARELHDNVAQSFAAVNLMLQLLLEQQDFPADSTRQLLLRVHTTARTANAELRRLIDAMQTPNQADLLDAPASKSISPASQKLVAIERLRRLGLLDALKEYFGHALTASVALQFKHQYQSQALALEVELFRIAQESVSNAIRHGRAGRVEVSLISSEAWVELQIDDNGGGAAPNDSDGLGLASMRSRAQRLGGHLELNRSSLGGVSVRVKVPCPSQS